MTVILEYLWKEHILSHFCRQPPLLDLHRADWPPNTLQFELRLKRPDLSMTSLLLSSFPLPICPMKDQPQPGLQQPPKAKQPQSQISLNLLFESISFKCKRVSPALATQPTEGALGSGPAYQAVGISCHWRWGLGKQGTITGKGGVSQVFQCLEEEPECPNLYVSAIHWKAGPCKGFSLLRY